MAVIAAEQRGLLDAEHGPPAHQQTARSPAAPVRGTNPRGGRGAPGAQPAQRATRAQPPHGGSGQVRKGDLQSLLSIFGPMA